MFTALLTLIFIRPFVSLIPFPRENLAFNILLFVFLAVYFAVKKMAVNNLRPLKWQIGAWVAVFLASVLLMRRHGIGLEELYMNHYVAGILLFVLVAGLDPGQKKKVATAMVLSAAGISLLAIHQYFFGFQRLLEYMTTQGIADPDSIMYVVQKRVFFPFPTPNTLAGYLAMTIPLTLTLRGNFRYPALCLLGIALLFTKSLGAFISLALALAIYAALTARWRKKWLVFAGVVTVAVAGILVARITGVSSQRPQLKPLFSTNMRFNYWQDTLQLIAEHPIKGRGLGDFGVRRSRYAHNSYLQIWAETGVIGLAAFLWLIYGCIVRGVRKVNAAGSDKTMIAALLASASAFMIHNLIDFTFFLPEICTLWWIILGLIAFFEETPSVQSVGNIRTE